VAFGRDYIVAWESSRGRDHDLLRPGDIVLEGECGGIGFGWQLFRREFSFSFLLSYSFVSLSYDAGYFSHLSGYGIAATPQWANYHATYIRSRSHHLIST
jgi:hypothetical protein